MVGEAEAVRVAAVREVAARVAVRVAVARAAAAVEVVALTCGRQRRGSR